MISYIDEDFWRRALTTPTWYMVLRDDFDRLEKRAEQEKDYGVRKRIKSEAYGLVEEALRSGQLPLADSGENLDAHRRPIDTIVIHHTSNLPGMTLERLNAIQLLRIYGRYYANPTDPKEAYFKGRPVWSGHFYDGNQVFWGYHWLVRADGSVERLLQDEHIGWHAGNWDVNTRSIGICIDDDLSDKEPSQVILQAIANLAKQRYRQVKNSGILGHCEVNLHTECPGHLFGERWKQKLLAAI